MWNINKQGLLRQQLIIVSFCFRYVTAYTMFPVFLLVIDQDVTAETAMRYPELYKDLIKVLLAAAHVVSIEIIVSIFCLA